MPNIAEFPSEAACAYYASTRVVGYQLKPNARGQIALPLPIAREWRDSGASYISYQDEDRVALIHPASEASDNSYKISSHAEEDRGSRIYIPSILRNRWGLNTFGSAIDLIDLNQSLAIFPQGELAARLQQLLPNTQENELDDLHKSMFSRNQSLFSKIGAVCAVKAALDLA